MLILPIKKKWFGQIEYCGQNEYGQKLVKRSVILKDLDELEREV